MNKLPEESQRVYEEVIAWINSLKLRKNEKQDLIDHFEAVFFALQEINK